MIGNPRFEVRTYDFDITLLELDRPTTFSPVPSVALNAVQSAPMYASGSVCRTYGWGLTSGNSPSSSVFPAPAYACHLSCLSSAPSPQRVPAPL